jgi:hypothetical protein
MAKFYISAKWQLKDQVERIYQILREKGHEITEDWTKHECIKPYDQDLEVSSGFAEKDLTGVLEADYLIHLSDTRGIGMYVELGAALALNQLNGNPEIYVVGEENNQSQFYFHPAVKRRKTFEEVMEEIENNQQP